MAARTKSRSVDEYIAAYPKKVQVILRKVRKIVNEVAPEAEEMISYGIISFRLKGYLVHFAAYKNHIGFYPTSSGIRAFKREISGYKHATGSVQFPLDKPMPYNLMRKIVKFRVRESVAKA
jgi:uncharacterized protein YdhG (YjbR/CyaY superfamily)